MINLLQIMENNISAFYLPENINSLFFNELFLLILSNKVEDGDAIMNTDRESIFLGCRSLFNP